PVNDIVLELVRKSDGAVLAKADTLTSPEAIHYAPGGDIPQDTYRAVVCPFDKNQNLLTTGYHGAVTLTELPLPGLPTPPPATKPGKVAFSGSASFAPATLVSAHFLGGEPQLSMERRIAGSQAGRLDPVRIYVTWPLTSRTQTSQLSRSADGGESFRLL